MRLPGLCKPHKDRATSATPIYVKSPGTPVHVKRPAFGQIARTGLPRGQLGLSFWARLGQFPDHTLNRVAGVIQAESSIPNRV